MGSSAPTSVVICEVGPRDGLQNEQIILSVDEKATLIDRLSLTGLQRIEVASFVSPRRVPQMADAEEVLKRITRRPGIVYAGLVLNDHGAARAISAGVDQIHFALVATETFNQRNQGASVAESLREFERIVVRARQAGVSCTAAIGAAFGCPFEGPVPAERVWSMARALFDAGAVEIVLADTIGVGVPSQVKTLVGGLRKHVNVDLPIGCHFHNTRNTGLANAYAAIEAGVRVLDASIGGSGGCPFAPRATGNVPTEDLAYMVRQMGVPTGLDIVTLIETAQWLEQLLQHRLPGMVMKAGLFPEVVEETKTTA